MKLKNALITLLAVFLFTSNAPVYAADNYELQVKPQMEPAIEPALEPVKEPQLQPRIVDQGKVDPDQPVSSQAPDYRNSINDIQTYIYENIRDTFASLHIDRDDKGREKIILSFIDDVSPKHKEEILALADKPELIVFRLVDFTEQQLAAKQKEIDFESLKDEGIRIHHTGVNVFSNRVEIGIEPYNKESVARIHEVFGSEMVEVVEGHEVELLAQSDGAGPAVAQEDAGGDQILKDSLNYGEDTKEIAFLKRIASFFKSIFNWFVQ